jgi:membrane protease YdiL (CAAX protease family)
MNKSTSTAIFFTLTFLLTWVLWVPAGSISDLGILPTALHYAGGVMPTLVTLYLLIRYSDIFERKDYWERLFDLKRIPKGWYLVIFLTVPALTIISGILDKVLGGVGVVTASDLFQNPLSLLPFVLFMLVFGPLPEEMAWRGYALDRLQSRRNALQASLILGIAWTVWHLPLFFIEGSYQHSLGIGTPQFWLYMLDKIPISVLMTWIYNNTDRSTVSAVLFHFMVNFVGEIFDLSLQGEIIYIAAWWLIAIIVTIIWKPEKLMLAINQEK